MSSKLTAQAARPSSPAETAFPGEDPHPETALEWWFVHGRYAGAAGERRFMISLFRHRTGPGSSREDQAFSLLLSLLDPATGVQAAVSRVGPGLPAMLRRNREKLRQLKVDPELLDAWLEELRAPGTTGGVERRDGEAELAAGPLRLEWDDVALRRSPDGFALEFDEPGGGPPVRLELRAKAAPFMITAARRVEGDDDGMNYRTWPRLDLRGRRGDEPVSGEAWLDHQWGEYGWLAGPDRTRELRGWDWFGFSLEDGSDWILGRHFRLADGRTLSRNLTVRDPRGGITDYQDFEAAPGRWWESPRTLARYPVAWHLRVPELEADITFKPLADDQELRVFGLVRAVWEGAGEVTGTIAGQTVRRLARAEFTGYATIRGLSAQLEALAARVDRQLESFLPRAIDRAELEGYLGPPTWKYEPRAYTEMLSGPVWDLVSRGGKRWRPILALLLLEAMGGDRQRYETLVCATGELPHTGSLIVDDIEDQARLRRGDQAIHQRYGTDVAINAGSTLYFLPSLLLMNHPHVTPAQRLEIHEATLRQQIRAHFGQGLDLYWSRHMDETNLAAWLADSPLDKIRQMYELKTSAPVEVLALAAAILSGTDPETRRECVAFARAIGVAFQILDDVLCFAPSEESGKAAGADLAEGKFTYVLCRALQLLPAPERERLTRILCTPELRADPAAVAEGGRIIRESKVLPACRREAAAQVEPVWERLRRRLKPSEAKTLLEWLYRRLAGRDGLRPPAT